MTFTRTASGHTFQHHGNYIGHVGVAGKVKENRVRRVAERQGLTLARSRRRDPLATAYGGYMVLNAKSGAVVAGGFPFAFCLSLDDAEAWLKTPPADRKE